MNGRKPTKLSHEAQFCTSIARLGSCLYPQGWRQVPATQIQWFHWIQWYHWINMQWHELSMPKQDTTVTSAIESDYLVCISMWSECRSKVKIHTLVWRQVSGVIHKPRKVTSDVQAINRLRPFSTVTFCYVLLGGTQRFNQYAWFWSEMGFDPGSIEVEGRERSNSYPCWYYVLYLSCVQLDGSLLTGQEVIVYSQRIEEGQLFMGPIPGEFLRVPHSEPQVSFLNQSKSFCF